MWYILAFIVLFVWAYASFDPPEKLFFNGREVCDKYNKARVFMEKNDVGPQHGFDKSKDSISVSYDRNDIFFKKLETKYGAPFDNKNFISYTVEYLTDPEMYSYIKNERVLGAYMGVGQHKHSYKKETSDGMYKIYRPSAEQSWVLFEQYPDDRNEGDAMLAWAGNCRKNVKTTKCSYYEILENGYKIDVRLPLNYMKHRKDIIKRVEKDLNTNIFCK